MMAMIATSLATTMAAYITNMTYAVGAVEGQQSGEQRLEGCDAHR